MAELFLDLEKCTHCGICVHACPLELFIMKQGKISIRHKKMSECIDCKLCYNTCPKNAILVKTENYAEKIMK